MCCVAHKCKVWLVLLGYSPASLPHNFPTHPPTPLPSSQVSDDLLSTEFKKGLGSEVGVDEDMGEAEMVEGSSAATGVEAMVEAEEGEKGGTVRLLPGPQWGQKRRYAARNLEKLLDRRGLMFTKSAAKCV